MTAAAPDPVELNPDAPAEAWRAALRIESADLHRVLGTIVRLGPSARAAGSALIQLGADQFDGSKRSPSGSFHYQWDDAVAALGADLAPAICEAVAAGRADLRRAGWNALVGLVPRPTRRPAGGFDPAPGRAALRAAGLAPNENRRGRKRAGVRSALSFLDAFPSLAESGWPVRDAAIRLLDHPHVAVRRAAAEAFGRNTRRQFAFSGSAIPRGYDLAPAAEPLARLLTSDPDRAVRDAAFWACAEAGAAGDQVVPRLLAWFENQIGAETPPRPFPTHFRTPDLGNDLQVIWMALAGYPGRAAETEEVVESWAVEQIERATSGGTVDLLGLSRAAQAGGRANRSRIAAVLAQHLDDPPPSPFIDSQSWPGMMLEHLGSLGEAAAGEAPRLLALLTGPDGRPTPETPVDQGPEGSQFPVTLALAQIAPAHPALPGLVFPVIPPPPPADLPGDFEELGLDDLSADAGLTRWTARWEAIERPLSAACKVLRAMGERAAPAAPRLLPHLERYRYSRPDPNLLAALGAIRPLPEGALPALARFGDRVDLREYGSALLPHLAGALAHAARPAEPLGRFGDDSSAERLADAQQLRRRALVDRLWLLTGFPPDDLAPHRDRLAAALEPLLREGDAEVRRWAVAAAGRLAAGGNDGGGNNGGRAALLAAASDAASDADPRVRAEAVRALAAGPDAEGVRAALAAGLADEFAAVRLPAVRAWRAAGFEPDALEPLRDDPNPAVRLAVAEGGRKGAPGDAAGGP